MAALTVGEVRFPPSAAMASMTGKRVPMHSTSLSSPSSEAG